MDRFDWELLLSLFRETNATGVARKMNITQPAITYRLKKMEEEFETELFVRHPRGISFTSAGKRLLDNANEMLRLYASIEDEVKNKSDEIGGTIHLGATNLISSTYLPGFLHKFKEKYPSIRIILYSGLSSELVDMLHEKKILIAIIRGEHYWSGKEEVILREPLEVVSAMPIHLSMLSEESYIDYRADPSLKASIDHWWKANYSKPPNVSIFASDSLCALRFVSAGLGISILPALRARGESGLFRKVICGENGDAYERNTRLLYHNYIFKLDHYRIFLDFFHNELPSLFSQGRESKSDGAF